MLRTRFANLIVCNATFYQKKTPTLMHDSARFHSCSTEWQRGLRIWPQSRRDIATVTYDISSHICSSHGAFLSTSGVISCRARYHSWTARTSCRMPVCLHSTREANCVRFMVDHRTIFGPGVASVACWRTIGAEVTRRRNQECLIDRYRTLYGSWIGCAIFPPEYSRYGHHTRSFHVDISGCIVE
jgi:hypothetical protein